MRTVIEFMSNNEKIKEEEAPILRERKNGIAVKTILDARGNRKMPKNKGFGFG